MESGSFFALLGPSGCGKTTTLRMIGGFEQPTEGRILLGEREVSELPAYKRDVNTVFQSYALFPHLSVFENVAFGLRRRSVRKRLGVDMARRRALDAIIADSGGGVETFFNVTLLENASLLRTVAPDAGEAIGLQLEPHRHGVRIGRILLLKATSLGVDPE